jgi:hypothetical protein
MEAKIPVGTKLTVMSYGAPRLCEVDVFAYSTLSGGVLVVRDEYGNTWCPTDKEIIKK